MAFGQAAGPPASAKQLEQLAEALADAGYDSFREARHPFGLTQRQSNGKFTRDEVSELLSRLEEGEGAGDEVPPDPAPPRPASRATPRPVRAARPGRARGAEAVVTAFPDELLAEELVRRGWTCTPPT